MPSSIVSVNSQEKGKQSMSEEDVKVLGKWASSFSQRVEAALKLKGVHYQLIDQDLFNKSPELLKYNPVHKKIPVLLHNGKPIAESLVILEYIDETWKHNPILPTHPYDKAMARFWAKFIDDKFWALWPAVKRAMLSSESEIKEREEAIAEAQLHLDAIETQLREKKFFGGEKLGFVEITASLLVWIVVAQESAGLEILTQHKFPAVHELTQRFAHDDVLKPCVPPTDELVAYFKARFSTIAAAAASASK